MIVKDGWKNFIDEVRTTGKPIVCFGVGAIATFIEGLFIDCGIWEKITFFLDNNPQKEGKTVGVSRKIPVITVNTFREKQISDFIFLIAIESYVTIEQQFSQYTEWRNISSYAYIKLNREIQQNIKQPYDLLQKEGSKIPKVIHYCWFGKSPKTKLHQLCLDSWEKHCPEYQIIEWNEDNYDVAKNLYMKQAYEAGKWAYVSDYARIDIIYHHGGIYLDTDVELIKSLDSLLGLEAFIAHGQWSAVNSGAGLGAVKGNHILKEILEDERNHIPFAQDDGGLNMMQNGFYETSVLQRHGFKKYFLMQEVDGMLILAPEIMATASLLGKNVFVTDRTISIHHCEGSWASRKILDERKETITHQQEAYDCGIYST